MSDPSEAASRRPLRWLAITVAVLLSLLAAAGVKSYRDLAAVRAHEAELEERISETRENIRRLDERLERIRNDPLMLERLAREELGMVRPGDVVIVLPEEGEEPESAEGTLGGRPAK